jgi:hypothetical protein
MATNRRSDRRNHTAARTAQLGLEGLEARMVLSGMPIDLVGLAQSVLTRLSDGRLPGADAGDVVTDVEATGFSVVLPSAVPNGLPVRALIMAVGADNRPASFSGEVYLSSSDEAAVLPESVSFSRGRAFVSVTFNTTGEQTLTASTVGIAPITGSDTTRVAAPIVATQLVMRIPESTRVDSPVKVMLMALDANGRSVPNFSGDVSLTSSDEAATLPTTVTFERGRAVATVTFGTPGEQTLTATAGDLTAEAATTVAAQPVVADFRIELRPDVVAGQTTRVAVVAIDADGEAIREFSGSATLASSDPEARLPETVQFRRGRAYFEVAFATLGAQHVTVTTGDIEATATTTVKAAPTVAALDVWLPRQVIAGLPMLAQLVAVDADGRMVRGFMGSLAVSSSDAAATLPSTVDFVNGIALLRVTFATAGEQTLSVGNADSDVSGSGTTTVRAMRLPSLPSWGPR